MNFRGQYSRGRNINLGGRPGAASTASVLRKAQQDREKREQARREERAAVRIQAFYRGRQQVWSLRVAMLEEWEAVYVTGDDVKVQLVPLELQRFVLVLRFCLRALVYPDHEVPARWQRDLKAVLDVFAANEHSLRASCNAAHELTNLADALQPFLVHEPFDSVSAGLALRLCLIVAQSAPLPPTIHTNISKLLLRLVPYEFLDTHEAASPAASPAARAELASLAASITAALVTDRPHRIIETILSIPSLDTLYPDLSPLRGLPAALAAHPDGSLAVNSLSVPQRLAMIANAALVAKSAGSRLNASSISLLHNVIQHANLTIVESARDDDDEPSSLQDNGESPEPGASAVYQAYAGDESNDISRIRELYTREHISSVLGLLATAYTKDNINAVASFYVGLIRLYPALRSSVTLYLSFASDTSAVQIFWDSLRQSDNYDLLSSRPVTAAELGTLAASEVTWTKLILALEVYSYWLVIADDVQFLENSTRGLAIGEVGKLAVYLKNLCYSLIWEWTKVESFSPEVQTLYRKVKQVALQVIRQIYTRDSRRPFLGTDFWLMTSLFDMQAFIPEVVEEQERQREKREASMDDSDDEDNYATEVHASSSRGPTGRAGRGYFRGVPPRLEMLKHVPFFMPFRVRVKIFRAFIDLDSAEQTPRVFDIFYRRQESEIHRETLLDDAFDRFAKDPGGFKDNINVRFYSQGMPEAGIDGGGLTKEFLTSVCQEGFDPRNGLFKTTDDHLLYPNPVYGLRRRAGNLNETERRRGLAYIKFLGQVIGKCLYKEILVDVEFAPFFLLKWAGRSEKNTFDDLSSLDPAMYQNLVLLRRYPGDVERDMALNFVTVQELEDGRQESIELRYDGENIAVTNENRLEYIHAVANYKLNVSLADQTDAFLKGMSTLISLDWLKMFNAKELQMLISGGSPKIDMSDLRANTVYGGYSAGDLTVQYFWEVVEELPEKEKQEVIKFVTSVPKGPLLGFGQLNPKFAIRNSGSDIDRLPTSSTCVNLLKLPDYKNKQLLKEKLLYSIKSGAGFDLS